MWEGKLGRLNEEEAGSLGISSTLKNDYHAVPATKTQHLKFLLKQLTQEVHRRMLNDGGGDSDPNVQYGINVCMDLMRELGCS